jgi:hypothetical protein
MSPEPIRDLTVEEDEFEIDDPELLAELNASLDEADRGETVPWEQVRKELMELRGASR